MNDSGLLTDVEFMVKITTDRFKNDDGTYDYVRSEDGKPHRIDDDLNRVLRSYRAKFLIRNFDISDSVSVLLLAWYDGYRVSTEAFKIKWIGDEKE